MRMPNLLATRRGRLTTFFFLYLTEGIPLGFVAVAVAATLRRQGVGPAEIGAFVGSFYLPWSFKWVMGPFVDMFGSERFGRRRVWIVATQSAMVLTLLATVGVDLPGQLKLFTIILLIHNAFAATQDVAIDALAVNTLEKHERGLANGLMFGAAYLGQAIGGSAVLFMMDTLTFPGSVVFVAAIIASVTIFIVLPMREPPLPSVAIHGWRHAWQEIWTFVVTAVKSFVGSRPAFVGLLFALLPAGAMSLGLALQSNLAVELGLDDPAIAKLSLWSSVLSAVGCVVGGQLSDKLGRRRMLGTYIAIMSLPVMYLAWKCQQYGWVMPVDMLMEDRPVPAAALVTAFWVAVLVYSWFNGLMYGTRTALFMDVTNPAVAGTQFTAYMALMNLTIAYSANWQGWWIERFGYPSTLFTDSIFGLVCLALLPFMTPRRGKSAPAPAD